MASNLSPLLPGAWICRAVSQKTLRTLRVLQVVSRTVELPQRRLTLEMVWARLGADLGDGPEIAEEVAQLDWAF